MLQGSSQDWPLDNIRNPRRPGVAEKDVNDQIPEDIARLREKETAPLEEVEIFILFYNKSTTRHQGPLRSISALLPDTAK